LVLLIFFFFFVVCTPQPDTNHGHSEKLVLFHSPHEFLIVAESDPRVAALRDQARADAADPGMSETRRLLEFPIGPDAARLGGRWAWQQVG
jgi:hypothetical protein